MSHPSASHLMPEEPRQRTVLDHFGTGTMILLLAVSLVFFIRLLTSRFLAPRYLLAVIAVLVVLNLIQAFVQIPLRRNKLGKLICGAVSLLLSAAMIWGMVSVGSVASALRRITGAVTETDEIAVAVRIDDPAQELQDTAGYAYGYISGVDQRNSSEMLEHLRTQLGDVNAEGCDGMVGLQHDLLGGVVDAVFFNTGYLSALQDGHDFTDFEARTRIIYRYTITREVQVDPSASAANHSFIMYCSGIDVRYGDLSSKGNSDVNILAVVNPDTRQVLLLNTPRDYYVALHMNGEYDKLTHAGYYGIEESMQTLADLYDVQIPYYARVNFAGLVEIVDALDGVDVESPMAFTTNVMDIPDSYGGYYQQSYYFDEGINHLSGVEALAFSRERDSFSDGDNQRGRNQMAVIRGIIDKALSPAILSRYQDVLSAVSDAFVTNMSYDEIAKLVQKQQTDMKSWNIVSYAVGGEGDMTYCFSYPGSELYVTRPDYETVEAAKELIRQVVDGETPVLPAA